jgi:D123
VDMNPAMEFRVFVINGKVVGISQRDPSHYFPYLEAMAVEMQRKIQKFISDKVRREVELYQCMFLLRYRLMGRCG